MPRATQVPNERLDTVTYGTITPSGRPLQDRSVSVEFSLLSCAGPYNPHRQAGEFGLFRVRSPLLAESFLFLEVLRCFSSPGALLPLYEFKREIPGH